MKSLSHLVKTGPLQGSGGGVVVSPEREIKGKERRGMQKEKENMSLDYMIFICT